MLWNTTGGRANSGACPRQADESTNSGLRSRIDEVSDKKGSQRRGRNRKGIGGQPDADDRTANAVFLALQAERLAGPTRRWTGRSMWRFGVRAFGVWVVAVGSLILVPSTASVAAEPLEMAPKYYSKQTRDGWQLSISIEGERINSVPNLAAATTSREGFVTLAATATAVGGATPITDSLFITGYQVGCQTDVSSGLGMGGSGAGGGNAGVGNTFINPVAASDSVGGAGGGAGFLQTTVQPGVIVEVPMANMALSPDGRAMLDIDNIHIKADACGGYVTIRSYAYLRVATAVAHTGFAVYGDPLRI